LASVLTQKTILDTKINICNEEIELILQSIDILEEQIDYNNIRLTELTAEKEEKYELFKKRIRVMYEEGNSSYLAVILEAESVEDFLNRAQLVGDILSQDKTIIREMESLCISIEDTTLQLEADKAAAEQKYIALESTKTELEEDYLESVELLYELGDEEMANVDLLEQYEQLWDDAAKEEQRLTDELLEQQRKAAESSRLASMQQTEPATEPPAVQTTSDEPDEPDDPPVTVTSYIWPTPGFTWITSDYGYRIHPVTGNYTFHTGIDIGAYYGTPILCIAKGTVVSNYYSSVYGNMIKVDHGNGIISLYAHLNAKSKYSVGSSVSQGTVLGYVGSTGMSTGPHLHLTIYCNGSLANPLNYVTPK
jgi:murein DD-endopeptidase MepM/ murein hydrolase activator NlpD